jgi:hypothetical protein
MGLAVLAVVVIMSFAMLNVFGHGSAVHYVQANSYPKG